MDRRSSARTDGVSMTPEQLVYKHQNLAFKARNKMLRIIREADRDDVLSAAYLGLWKAAKKFNAARNDDFSKFANIYIYGAIWDWWRTETKDTYSRVKKESAQEQFRWKLLREWIWC